MATWNPGCLLPSGIGQYLPSALSCPAPSYAQTLYNTITSPFSTSYSTFSSVMAGLASVPFLSFLVVPLFGSWSTSLNLLFFYLTWMTLILSHGPIRVEIISTLAVRTLFYLVPSAIFFAFDALIPSAAESFKAMGAPALPLRRASRKKTLRYARFFAWSVGNILLSTLAQTAVAITVKTFYPTCPTLNVSISLPAPFRMFTGILKGYLTRELLSYLTHRYLLHSDSNSPITAYLTCAHESWYHSLATPIPLSGSYDHPAAYLVRSLIPQLLPAVLFRFHLLTYLLYLTLISLEETFAFSGYSSVPTNFILGGIARRTDAHVACGGEGNYGCWGLMDWIMGTTVGGDLLDDIEDEADKHDLEGRARRNLASGKAAIKGRSRKMIEDLRRGSAGDEDEPERERAVRAPRRRKAAA